MKEARIRKIVREELQQLGEARIKSDMLHEEFANTLEKVFGQVFPENSWRASHRGSSASPIMIYRTDPPTANRTSVGRASVFYNEDEETVNSMSMTRFKDKKDGEFGEQEEYEVIERSGQSPPVDDASAVASIAGRTIENLFRPWAEKEILPPKQGPDAPPEYFRPRYGDPVPVEDVPEYLIKRMKAADSAAASADPRSSAFDWDRSKNAKMKKLKKLVDWIASEAPHDTKKKSLAAAKSYQRKAEELSFDVTVRKLQNAV